MFIENSKENLDKKNPNKKGPQFSTFQTFLLKCLYPGNWSTSHFRTLNLILLFSSSFSLFLFSFLLRSNPASPDANIKLPLISTSAGNMQFVIYHNHHNESLGRIHLYSFQQCHEKWALAILSHPNCCSNSNILAVANKSVMICKPTIYGNHIPSPLWCVVWKWKSNQDLLLRAFISVEGFCK